MSVADEDDLPIGVFDSGLGGLTVVREIRRRLPAEDIVYLGDSARVPYGTRSARTVIGYAWKCSRFLLDQGLKMLVVACNTASAVALPSLRDKVGVPVLGVITAGARAAVAASKSGGIGVIGTTGTISSGAYPLEIGKLDPGARVHGNPAPLLVPLAEEGWLEGDVPRAAAARYIGPLVREGIDVLLLGCTHYPILVGSIREALESLGSTAGIVDSATAMTADVERALADNGLARAGEARGRLDCFVTDLPASFEEVAGRFLGEQVSNVEKVDIA